MSVYHDDPVACEAAELIDKALTELKVHGWVQGHMGTVNGPKCLVGALCWAATGDPLLDPRRSDYGVVDPKTAAYLRAVGSLSRDSGGVISYNDTHNRKFWEIRWRCRVTSFKLRWRNRCQGRIQDEAQV